MTEGRTGVGSVDPGAGWTDAGRVTVPDAGESTAPISDPGASSAEGFPDDQLARYGRWLFVIVLLAYSVWEVFFLLLGPSLATSQDELGFVYESLRLPGEGRLTGYNHGVLLYELIAIVEAIGYVATRAWGIVQSPDDYVAWVLSNLHLHLTAARLIVGITGGLLIWQVYRLGKHYGGAAVGGMAAMLVATNMTVLTVTATTKEDALLWALLVAAMEIGWRASVHGSQRLAVFAGMAIGAATATKYFGVFGFLLCIVPLILARSEDRRRALRLGIVMGVTAGVTLLILMPFLITDRATVIASVLTLSDGATQGGGPTRTIWFYISPHLPNLIGWTIMVAAVVEAGLRIRKHPRGPVLLLMVPVALVLVLGARTGFSQAYYAMPLAILFVILASSLAVRIVRTYPGRSWRWAAPAAVLATALFTDPFLPGAIKHGILLNSPDTRTLALDYLHANAAPGSCVMITAGSAGENFFGPPILPIPDEMETSDGVFGRARRVAVEQAGGPYYDLRLLNLYFYAPSDALGCDWLVIPRLAPGRLSAVEFGESGPDRVGYAREEETRAPEGFVEAATFHGMPEWHSFLQPWYSAADYEEMGDLSIGQVWREGQYGRTQVIYRNVAGVAAPSAGR